MSLSLTVGCEDLHLQVMSVKRLRCVDCRAVIWVPYEFGHIPGLIDGRAAARTVLDHARAMPLLHPTLLPEHHALRRTP